MARARADESVAIDCIDRWGHSDPTPAIDDVTFALPTGELMCIAGPTGSGKSMLVAALAGASDATFRVAGGEATVAGISIRRPGRRLRELTYRTG